jgi:hypothetical protein
MGWQLLQSNKKVRRVVEVGWSPVGPILRELFMLIPIGIYKFLKQFCTKRFEIPFRPDGEATPDSGRRNELLSTSDPLCLSYTAQRSSLSTLGAWV